MLKRLVITLAFLGIANSFAAFAVPDITPANSVLNPRTETLYVIDNSGPRINVFSRTATGWQAEAARTIDLSDRPAGTTCYGMVVNSTGRTLYVGLSGSNPLVRRYNLDDNGYVTGAPGNLTSSFDPGVINLRGMALNETRNHLYVADGDGGLYVYNVSAYPGTQIQFVVSGIPTPHLDVAVNGDTIFVSNRSNTGRIVVYRDSAAAINPVSYDRWTGTYAYPTDLKVAGGRLYVAVNGADGNDVAVYDATRDLGHAAAVQSGIVGGYGWTSLDISVDNKYIFFKKANSATEIRNYVYYFRIPDGGVSGLVNRATSITNRTTSDSYILAADGFVVGRDRSEVALTYSPNGRREVASTGLDNFPPPTIDLLNVHQYRLDDTEIVTSMPGEPVVVGVTNDQQVRVTFPVDDPNDDDLLVKILWHRKLGPLSWPAEWEEMTVGTFSTAAGPNTIDTIFPPDGEPLLEAGTYEWKIYMSDGLSSREVTPFGRLNDDFIVDLPYTTPPEDFSKIDPPIGVTERGTVIFSWEAANDPDIGIDDGELVSYSLMYQDTTADGMIHDPVITPVAGTTYTAPAAGFAIGHTYRWQVTAIDRAGNRTPANDDTAWDFSYYKLDDTGPATRITTPFPGAVVEGEITLGATVTDLLSWIGRAEYFIGAPGENGAGTAMTAENALDSRVEAFTAPVSLEDGANTIYVHGMDREGTWGPMAEVSVFVSDINNPPNAFGKTNPANESETTGDVTFRWEASEDPEGTPVSYAITIYNDIDPVTGRGRDTLTSQMSDTNSSPVIADRFTPGNTYYWNVEATDNAPRRVPVLADAGTLWSFTYRAPIIRPGEPYIMETSPANDAEGVFINAPITLTFSETMNDASVEEALELTDLPDGGTYSHSWNGTKTVLTITHETNFSADTDYTVTLGAAAADLGGDRIVPGDVPNPFTFTTGDGEGGDVVVVSDSITIARGGDNADDPINITWSTDPADQAVDIYVLECTRGADGEYTAYFTSDVSAWDADPSTPLVIDPTHNNVDTGSLTDATQVGRGTAKYYKIMPHGVALTSEDLNSDVVGKFDLSIGPDATFPERIFISMPLVVVDSSPESVIGGQVNEGDVLLTYNINQDVTEGSMYRGGAWIRVPGPTVTGIVEHLELGHTYGYLTGTERFITVVGAVRNTDFTRTLTGAGGGDEVANWLGNPYPVPVPIASIGLNDSSTFAAARGDNAANLFHYNAVGELIPAEAGASALTGMARHYSAADQWSDATWVAPSRLIIVPGKGYMFTEPVHETLDWNLSRPY